MAYLSAGRGVMIHRQNCGNLAEYRKQPDKWLSVAWEPTRGRLFSSEIQLEINNRVGVLAAVASSIAGTETNIDQVSLEERDVNSSSLKFQVQVRDRKHLAARHPHRQAHAGCAAGISHAGVRHIVSAPTIRTQGHEQTNHFDAECAGRHRHLLAGGAGGQYHLGLRPDPHGPGDQGIGEGRHGGSDTARVRQLEGHRRRGRRHAGRRGQGQHFLTDLSHFALVNKIMAEYFREPYPARAAVGVASLPRGAQFEVECIVAL